MLTDSDSSSVDDWRVPIFFSYRFLVAMIAQLGLICSFASQSILGASLLTMIRNGSDVNRSGIAMAAASVFHNDAVDSEVGVGCFE